MRAQGSVVDAHTTALMRAGLKRAERGLAGLLAAPVTIVVDTMTLAPVLALDQLADAPETAVVGIYVGFDGDLSGHCLLSLDQGSALKLARRLLGGAAADADLADSALLEAGNITVSGLVNGVADNGRWVIRVSTPVLARDMLGALVNSILAAASVSARELLGVEAQFRTAGEDIAGTLLLLPDADSLRALTAPGRQWP